MVNPSDKDNDAKPKSIADIVTQLDEIVQRRNPTIEHYLCIETYFSQINEAVRIIRSYTDAANMYDVARMSQDVIILSAIHVSAAEMIGYVQGYARRAEDNRKVTKSQYAIDIKRKRDQIERENGVNIKITEQEVDNASRILASNTYIEAADAETISNMTRMAWYAIGDFIKILNAAINRAHQELLYNGNQNPRS